MRKIVFWLFIALFSSSSLASTPFTAQDVLQIQYLSAVAASPGGAHVAYIVNTPRSAREEAGGAYNELYVHNRHSGENRGYITGKTNLSAVQWSPDGRLITFLGRRDGAAATQLYALPVDGGEAYALTASESSVSFYRWHPDGQTIAYIAETPKTAAEKNLDKKGYGFIFYEENLKHRNLYLLDLKGEKSPPRQLTQDVTVWDFEFDRAGARIAASVSAQNLVDHQYMFRKLVLIDAADGRQTVVVEQPWKLGNYAFNPSGTHLAYAAARERKDHAVSQAFVIDLRSRKTVNLTPRNYRGHIHWVDWRDDGHIRYRASEGVQSLLVATDLGGTQRQTLLHSARLGFVFNDVSFDDKGGAMYVAGQSPNSPGHLYRIASDGTAEQLTHLNPWLSERKLGEQTIYSYKARDGQVIEGLLIHPAEYERGKRYPLVVLVHGGPESHYSNGWLTRYSEPGQALAGRGYFVFYPNYRASTGYGVEFALAGFGDPAGVEFDDVADGIKALVKEGLVDGQRVGLGGGSYGGYAAAWFGTYYTRLVRAACMFVGISDLVSKGGTTDIPYEDYYVHMGKRHEEMWDLSLKRSPVYWAHQSKTAMLIFGGAADTRVHPSQSMELYRRLKMNDHPAVRLVQYPGEGHGNRRQTGQIDVLHRTLAWYDWYVRDLKPLDGPMPPLDISEAYGL